MSETSEPIVPAPAVPADVAAADAKLQSVLAATAKGAESFQTVAAEEDASGISRRAGRGEREVVAAFATSVRITRQLPLDNPATVNALGELAGAVAGFLERRDKAALLMRDKRMTVNGKVVRAQAAGGRVVKDLLRLMKNMGTGGFIFRGTWTKESVVSFFDGFTKVDARTPADRYKGIAEAAKKVSEPALLEVLTVDEGQNYTEDDGESGLSDTERAAFYYARLIALGEASRVAVTNDLSPDFHVRHLRHTLIRVIEFLRAGLFEVRLLALTALPLSEKETLAAHQANTTVLALAMGRLLGLQRGQLGDLGFAAFYHDLGRSKLGWKKDDDGEGEDRAAAESHVLVGVGSALRTKSFSDAGLLRIVVIQEHHRKADRYPAQTGLRKPHLFSRILAVADAFDKLQHGTAFTKRLGAAAALRELAKDEKRYDAPIVALLRDVVGDLPRGTLLKMKDGSVSLVLEGGARRGNRPVVARLLLPDGQPDERRTLSELEDRSAIERELAPDELDLPWKRVLVA